MSKQKKQSTYEYVEQNALIFDGEGLNDTSPLAQPIERATVAVVEANGVYVSGVAVLKPGDTYNAELGATTAKLKLIANLLDRNLEASALTEDTTLEAFVHTQLNRVLDNIMVRRETAALKRFSQAVTKSQDLIKALNNVFGGGNNARPKYKRSQLAAVNTQDPFINFKTLEELFHGRS